ncbi:hypothetical protein CH063_07303 [Colletotrichum higginsianum]|uniref:Uncharacterized protein n=2 Tax=Colletotrichum higginsianum TaxID=80884 RepID=H1V5P6_COLHI|nr:hypothetical protein CH63R_13829 [Colletotrichum higginsianum IMI 349063]OBR02603.1 hypothetical protein CH63R_13829 [Colletotrichum higginsianum IMI 349063]TID06690.1 hypothetical protein CH35J_000335 [Colletotrichum higginsianum]CCF35548.1 hypothetical protein CH063_07303 [Colletotrichum higginsianum]
MRQSSTLLAAALAFVSAAVAQQVILAVRTSTVIQCVTVTPGLLPICAGCAPIPTIHPPTITGGPICVEIEAPECKRCGCNTCTQTVKYTTEYDAFCSTGITRQKYEVTETYKGVAAKPTIPSADIPLGFTKEVQTCTTCGPTPITATITRPITEPQGTPVSGPDGRPLSAPIAGPGAVPSSGPGSAPGGSGNAPGAGSSPGAVSTVVTVVTADSRTVVPLAVGYAALLVSAFAMTAFFL